MDTYVPPLEYEMTVICAEIKKLEDKFRGDSSTVTNSNLEFYHRLIIRKKEIINS